MKNCGRRHTITHFFNRNHFGPLVAGTITHWYNPLFCMAFVTLVQLVVPSEEFSSKPKPVAGNGHEITTVFVAVRNRDRSGAPGVCTPESKLQKPPVSE